ncbi:AAA family ATPase (plasmid) [Haladaptatus sp. SPP-AMP-3]|uniref:McrB family protein n=1 Tax=Haladaptatus sp. SPP-AMP-3 TaxID=3121295 RepID=UPI003C2FE9C1
MAIHQFVCDTNTQQECLAKQLFGEKDMRETPVEDGDTLILCNYQQNTQYGPFEATTDQQQNIDSTAWNGRFTSQVRVTWGDIYQLKNTGSPLNVPSSNNPITNNQEATIIDAFRTTGTPVTITSDGTITLTEQSSEDATTTLPLDELIPTLIAQGEWAVDEVVNALETAREPGTVLLRTITAGELRTEHYRESLAHLLAGKNIVLYGPPGSGKTRAATRIGDALCPHLAFATANAEWTHHNVVGGYQPAGDTFVPTPGVLTTAASQCEQSLRDDALPSWLVIDELNRANLDQAFGDVFTALDLGHRMGNPLTYAGENGSQLVPLAFRIIATMNTQDRAQLFSLGYAFRRRFAFVNVPSLFAAEDTQEPIPPSSQVDLSRHIKQSREVIETAVLTDLNLDSKIPNDSPFVLPVIEAILSPQSALKSATGALSTHGGTDFIDVILRFVQVLSDKNIVDIGQGLVIDAIKFIIIYRELFPDSADWTLVDTAMTAYIVPQLDAFGSELRRATTVASDTDAVTRFTDARDTASALGFTRTASLMDGLLNGQELL